jgi:hypothetical protein
MAAHRYQQSGCNHDRRNRYDHSGDSLADVNRIFHRVLSASRVSEPVLQDESAARECLRADPQ